MLADSNFAFFDESTCNAWSTSLALCLTLTERLCLREAQSEKDDQDGWAGTKPEEWPPTVRCGVNKSSSESRG